jgi:hypothetical protein
MRKPPKRSKAPGDGHAKGPDEQNQGTTDPTDTLYRNYAQAVRSLSTDELMLAWARELSEKPWRARQVFLFADTNIPLGDYAEEVKTFKQVSRVLCWCGSANT